MAGKTNLSATLFSQKKLLGKTSTGTHRADSNEPIPSGLQVSTSAVFAEDVPPSPTLTLNTVQEGTVEYVEFGLTAITGSTYDANDFDSDSSSQSSGPHAYRLTLPSNYTSVSNNSKKGQYPFVNNQILHWTLGSLQVVSPGFSNDVPNPYTLKIFKADDTEIPLLDEIDWQIDYFSGILFVQDYDSAKIPATAKGFIYTGKMLSQSLGEVSSGGGGGSGTGVGWFGSGNGSISTSGSVYFGTQNTSNPEIFFSSVGAATFNEQGRNVDFRVETTGDQNTLFVKGNTDRVGIGTNSPVSLLHLKDKDPTLTLQREHNASGSSIDFLGSAGHTANSIIHDGSTNDLVFKTFNGTSVEEIMRLGDHYGDPNRQVILLSGSGMHAGAMQPRESQDISFYVSGAIGSKDSSVKGASVFGGDVVASGSLTSKFGLSGSLTKLHDGSSYLVAGSNVTISSASNGQITISSTGGGGGGGVNFSGGNGSNNQMITADGSGDIVAETNITFNGSELNVSGDILPGSDNTFDLGSPTARFANIYTGDLHLRNERGHWQIVEEADALTVINRLTGKRYKMVLEPYEEEEK